MSVLNQDKAVKPSKDAYGEELWAHLKGRGGPEIVERDDGHIAVSVGPGLYFSEYKDWKPREKKGIRYARGRILDIGCGAGRHSLYLQNKGFDVTGIDNSPLAIQVCKARGLKKAKVLSITETHRLKPGTFDTILMLGNNSALFASPKRGKWLLRRFLKITSPKARIIAENLDPFKTDDPDHLEYHKRNIAKGRAPGQVRIRVRFGKHIGEWFDYLFVSKKEMEDIIKGTGWRIRKYIETEGSPGYVAIIEKRPEP